MKTKILTGLIVGMFSLLYANLLFAQEQVEVELFLSPIITETDNVSATTLGIKPETGRGTNLMTLIIRNFSTDAEGPIALQNLYLEFSVTSSNPEDGTIATVKQQQGRPFSLRANQIVRANNNQLQDGLPGVPEALHFDTDIPDRTMNYITGGLPEAIYTVILSIYEDQNGRRLLAQDVVEFEIGGGSIGGGESTATLVTPGGPPGQDISVPTRRPFFSWSGGGSSRYRVIIVNDDENNGGTSGLEAARLNQVGSNSTDYVVYDKVFEDSNQFTYPASGQNLVALERGGTYFWQVLPILRDGNSEEYRNLSEVYEFRVESTGGGDQAAAVSDSDMDTTIELLQRLMSDEEVARVLTDNLRLASVNVDGTRYTGEQALSQLFQLLILLDTGNIEIVD